MLIFSIFSYSVPLSQDGIMTKQLRILGCAGIFVLILLFYITVPFNVVCDILAQISFDRKIDPESLPYLRLLYHGVTISILLFCMLAMIWNSAIVRALHNACISLNRISATKWLIGICIIGATIRIAMIFFYPNEQVSDFQEYHECARRLAAGEGYLRNGQATAWFPIGYPFFLSMLYRIAGSFAIAGQLANIALSLLIIACTYLVAKKLGSTNTAKLASLIVALWPNLAAYTLLLCSDILFTALFTGLITVLLLYPSKRIIIQCILIGFLFAAATLTRTGLALYAMVAAWYCIVQSPDKRFSRLIGRGIIIMCAAIVIFAPWWIRNYQVFDRFVPLSTNGGFNFWLGNVQLAQGNDPGMPVTWPTREDAVSSHGYKIGLDYIRKHPTKFIIQIPVKIINLFLLDISGFRWVQKGIENSPRSLMVLTGISQLYYMLMLCMSIAGIIHIIRKRTAHYTPGHLLILYTVAYWIMIHCIFFGKDRYHLPLIPLIAVYAGHGFLLVYQFLLHNNKPIQSKE